MKHSRTLVKMSIGFTVAAALVAAMQFFFIILPIYRLTSDDLNEQVDTKLHALQTISGVLLVTIILLVILAAACIFAAAIVNLKKDDRK